jgi:hypothetical protein
VSINVSWKLIDQDHERETSQRCFLPVVQLAFESDGAVRSKPGFDVDVCPVAFADPKAEARHRIERAVRARLATEHEGYEFILEGFHTLFPRVLTGRMLGCVSWWQLIQRVIDGGGRRGALSRSIATIPQI